MTAEQFPTRQREAEATVLPPEDYHPATMGKEPAALQDLGEGRNRRFEFDRLTNQQDGGSKLAPWQTDGGRVIISAVERERYDVKVPFENGLAFMGEMGRRLGSNQLWNVLHQFRAQGEDSAVEKEKFDQLAFGAILLLGLLMLMVIALVAL
jgi:hypothetical protein